MRRIATPLLTIAAVASLGLAGCGGSSAPALTDPIDILVQSVASVEDAKSVHLKLEIDGQVPLDLAGGLLPGSSASPGGSGGPGGTIDLGGTTVEGDVDIEGQAAKLAFALPAILNLSGEVIVVDDALYVKASLLGDKYRKLDSSDAGSILPGMPSPGSSASPAATDPTAELRSQLEGLENPPVKLADERCGDTDCYHVQVKLDAADAEPLASLAPDMAATATVDVYVRKNDLHPSQLAVTANAGEEGNLSATLNLSAWDANVDIQAPPADQVTEGSLDIPGFDIPGLLPSATP